jgi:hypothetical protein
MARVAKNDESMNRSLGEALTVQTVQDNSYEEEADKGLANEYISNLQQQVYFLELVPLCAKIYMHSN